MNFRKVDDNIRENLSGKLEHKVYHEIIYNLYPRMGSTVLRLLAKKLMQICIPT